jgi:hypothetical protein
MHLIPYLIVFGLGFAVGRVKNWKEAQAKFNADVEKAKNEAKSI